MDRNYDVTTFFQKSFILRTPGVAILADIIKIVTIFIKKPTRTEEKLEDLEIVCLNGIYTLFLDIVKFANFQ